MRRLSQLRAPSDVPRIYGAYQVVPRLYENLTAIREAKNRVQATVEVDC
jgi:hypothetical protein